MRLRHALALAAALGACDEPKKDSAAPSAAASASEAPAPSASAPAGPRPFSVMPDMFVDDSAIAIGPERIDLNKADGAAKLKETVDRVPADNKQVTLRTTTKASPRDVGAVITQLGKHGVPTILLKMEGGRKDLPGEIVITPEGRIESADDCSVVASVLEDLSTGVWTFKGGGGKKARKGLSGPDITATGDNIQGSLKGCGSKTAFFSVSPKLRWEHAFHIGALIRKTDADAKIDKLVYLSEEPVAGRPVKLPK